MGPMAKKKPKGRPRSPKPREVVVCSRLTKEQARKLNKLAKEEGLSVSDWVHRRVCWELR